MPKNIQRIVIAILPFMFACGPLVHTIRDPSGMSTSVECRKSEGELFVDFRLAPIPDDTPCRVEFEGSAPEKLEVLARNGYSLVRWKVDQAHLKTFSTNLYNFKLITPSNEYSVSIKLQPTSQQIIAATIQSLLRLH